MILSAALSLLLLATLAAPGIAILDRFASWLTPLERTVHGSVLGIVAGTLAMVPIGTFAGFTTLTIAGIGAGCLAIAALLRFGPGGRGGRRNAPDDRTLSERVLAMAGRLDPWATGFFVILAVRWTLLWTSIMTIAPDGLWAGHEYIWSDWPTHLGIVARFAYGGNFPPVNTLFAGLPLSYHYLTDLTPAAFVVLGMDPVAALPFHSFVLSMLVALGIWAFVRRLVIRPAAATLATFLFLFGAGLGWLIVLGKIDQSHDFLGTLANGPWDPSTHRSDLNLQIFNPYIAFLMSQRAFLYGIPIVLLTVTLLVRAARRGARGTFVLAGLAAGLLPLAHLPTLLALAMVTPFLIFLLAPSRASPARLAAAAGVVAAGLALFAVLLTMMGQGPTATGPVSPQTLLLALVPTVPFVVVFLFLGPWRLDRIPWVGWLLFHGVWIALAVPQLVTQLGGGAGALANFRAEIGWVMSQDTWPWFWLKNMGLFIPLGLVAFFARKALPPRSSMVLLGFMAIFVIANLLVFQPWDWDNHKILIYWMLATATLCGAVLSRVWRDHPSGAVRLLLILAVATMVMDPFLENLTQAEGYGRYRMLTAEQVDLAAQVRDKTDSKALIVSSWEHDDPIAELSGRQVLMGYWGQLQVSGIPFTGREADIRAIFELGPTADSLMRRYHVDYVVIGPEERTDAPAMDEAGFAARFPAIIQTDNYVVYDVRSASGE